MPDRTTEAHLTELKAQAALIVAARLTMQLTQLQAAEQLGVPLWTYRSYEYGTRGCPIPVRVRIVTEWQGDRALLGDTCPCCGRAWP